MSGKKMYSTELKLEIVQRYLQGDIGMRQLAKDYHIGSRSEIRKWIYGYREHGVSGLCTTPRTYSGDFKVSVVEYMHNTGATSLQASAYFNIPSRTTVRNWERIYYQEGKAALYEERRGKGRQMENKKPGRRKKAVKEQEDLLAEVQRLRMENEYLKKLNALIQDREKLEKPTK